VTTITTRKQVAQPTPTKVPWTSRQLDELRRVAPLGQQAAADILGRSVWSVKQAAYRHGISLRQTGSRAGRLLGQPNGTSYADARAAADHARLVGQLRAELAAGAFTLDDLDRALEAIDAGVPLCPMCGRNPADRPKEGICTACHNRRLEAAHLAALDSHEAQQGLWRARQNRSRAKRRPPTTEDE
jgi:hypothetical protein